MHLYRRTLAAGLVLLICSRCVAPVPAAYPVKINGTPLNGSGVSEYLVSPDNSSILYYSDEASPGAFEVYIAPIGGGPSTKLNVALPVGGSAYMQDLGFTSDGQHVLYLADEANPQEPNLYMVAIEGGASQRLNTQTSPQNGSVMYHPFAVQSNDGDRVIFRADGAPTNDLYVVGIDGDLPIKLNSPPLTSGNTGFADSRFSPDDNYVVMVTDENATFNDELFVVPVGGGAYWKLNETLFSGTEIGGSDFEFTSNSQHVVYMARVADEETEELFSVPITGGPSTKLNSALPTGGDVIDFFISPGNSKVVYVADQDSNGDNELYINSIHGGTPLKLNAPLAPGGDVEADGVEFSPDGNFVVFQADVLSATMRELFIVPTTGGTPVKLNGPLVPGGNVSDSDTTTQFSHDGTRVVYAADQDTDGVTELYSVPSAGGVPVKLNNSLTGASDVQTGSVRQNIDGTRLLYVADPVDNMPRLFVVPIAGGTPVDLTETLPANEDVDGAEFTADGDYVVFTSAVDGSSERYLYSKLIRQRMLAASGHLSSADGWNHGQEPDASMELTIDAATTVRVGTSSANTIALGGAGHTSTLQLDSDDWLSVANGLTVHNRGVVRGDGQIVADVFVEAGGEIRASGSRQRLHFSGVTFDNAGRIEAIGTAFDQAEVEFDAPVTNAAATGLITGSHARLRFDGGLTNAGSLALSVGESHVFGDIVNTGRITVTGGAAVTFYDDIAQNGILTISKVGNTSSAAIFLGDVSGSGTLGGGGDVFLEGDLRPGNSPGTITFNNNIFLGALTNVDIELGGTTPGLEFDTIDVNGQLALDGVFRLSFIDAGEGSFLPDGGSAFELIHASNGITGQFADTNLENRGGVSFELAYSGNAVSLLVSGVRGDYNYDGQVDSADFVLWRKLANTTTATADGNGDGTVDDADRLVWSQHVGQSAVIAQLGATASVPEPMTLSLVVIGCAATLFGRHRRAHGQ